METIKEALTFDDVTLAPNYSEILPSEVNTSVNLTDQLKIEIPILSSAMDTVTESSMSIAMAKAGGLGIIHRNLKIEEQIKEIRKVKSKNKFFEEWNLLSIYDNVNFVLPLQNLDDINFIKENLNSVNLRKLEEAA